MAIRRILEGSNPRLRTTARPVEEITQHVVEILDDMQQTMYAAGGVGLAAPQVGVNRRLVVIDVGDGIIELVNPEIVLTQGEQCHAERCLSFPGVCGTVARPERIVVRALDRHGELREYTGTELLAVALAHEIDHLDGVLFVDKVREWVEESAEEGALRDDS